MAPGMVCVVLTGMPKCAVPMSCDSAGCFRGKSAERRQLGNALPHGLDDAPAPGHGPAAHRDVGGR
jgi:hypothetical protein